MKVFYCSIYGPLLTEYILYKRSLGYKYQNIEYCFRKFDLLADERDETTIGISKELCDQWAVKRANESEKTWYSRIQIIKEFCTWLSTMGYQSCQPKLPKIKTTYAPYIYSKNEVQLLFEITDRLKTERTHVNSIVLAVPCLFRLLYATGLRLGEALSLMCSDVNINEQVIILRNSKNGTDRMIPISDSTTQVCKDYLNCRSRFPLRRKTDLLFIHPNGDRCMPRQAYRWFRKVLYKAGIPHQGNHRGPHIHHLRHTFSVHSLAAMAEANLDLYYSLPILSTYLGHTSVLSTNQYVRLTAEMFPSVIAKVNEACKHLYPELIKQTFNEN